VVVPALSVGYISGILEKMEIDAAVSAVATRAVATSVSVAAKIVPSCRVVRIAASIVMI